MIIPGKLHISRSLAKCLKQSHWRTTVDKAFKSVVQACASPRPDADGTWITSEMVDAYCQLHQLGHAHSIEIWQKDKLVGGLYGVAVGAVFCGESMFSYVSNASKVALVQLDKLAQRQHFELIDCQLPNPHLTSMGATALPRSEFLQRLAQLQNSSCIWPNNWPD